MFFFLVVLAGLLRQSATSDIHFTKTSLNLQKSHAQCAYANFHQVFSPGRALLSLFFQ